MSCVRFATLCDAEDCLRRSEEYSSWPTCRECGADVCPQHADPSSLHESDGKETVVCLTCAEFYR
jgi:hypothetical protein